ncbi:hypothetical protein COJ85_10040 [Bacillus sp. AFS076308]|uniref:hypothetical protein n=1 Tax=unclassified Bacillus (in: firmicutes) TaxID=185979 RepID=UPI000BF92C3E|nr:MULTISPECIES: hypothetical protein [unclassified Bacillus (in: firmicutes)]PFO05060.1 hypothetical protein COJ85_10040 [Bacillus sp. AFS076308]PGV50529.1 hypothetical protein COD92_17680 [Bacillus sp. AFS037270]
MEEILRLWNASFLEKKDAFLLRIVQECIGGRISFDFKRCSWDSNYGRLAGANCRVLLPADGVSFSEIKR